MIPDRVQNILLWLGALLILSRSFKLKAFQKFDSAAAAVEEAASVVDGKVTPRLASLLDEVKNEKKVSLAVADPKLGMCNLVLWQSITM